MTLRRQFWLLLALLICALLGSIIVVSQGILLNNFIDLEDKQVISDTETAAKVIHDDIAELTRISLDWSFWDDTYYFLEDQNQDYIDANLAYETFDSLKVNWMIYVLNDGSLSYSKGYDLQTGASMDIPASLVYDHFLAGKFLVKHEKMDECSSGLVVLPEGIMMAASCPILHNDRSGPSRGSFIVGRYLDNAIVQKMRELTNLNIQIELFNNPAPPEDFIAAKAAFSNGQSIFITTPSSQQINGYTLLMDGLNNPAIILKVERSRAIYQQGVSSFSIFALIVLVLGVLFSLIFFHFLNLRILTRLQMLSREFKQIGLNKDLNNRVAVKGSDEISFLAEEINRTLSALEISDIALKHNEERLRLLVDGAEDIIYLQDLDGKYVYFNGPTQYKLTLNDIIGKMPADLFDPHKAEEIMGNFHKVVETGEAVSSEITSQLFGNDQWFSNLIYPVKSPSGEILAIGTISRNVSAYKHMEERLRFSALHDPLTGLPNRAYYMEKVSHLTDQNRESYKYFSALLALDLDHFKQVNDTYGHPAGDQLLIEVGRRLQGCVRPGDTVARLGGDEFSIILEKVTGIEDATQVADRILSVFLRPVKIRDNDVIVTTSIGIALVSSFYHNLEDLLRNADIALYQAKSEGKDCYHIFDNNDVREDMRAMLKFEAGLRQAVGRAEFCLVFQPILSAKDKKISCVEALIRWNSPGQGFVNPLDFIPIAEETSLILPIGEWVLQEACAQLKAWRDGGFPDLEVAVNISARQLNDQDLVGITRAALVKNGLPGSALHLEIAENTAIQHFKKSAGVFAELNRMGIQIDIDEFGTNYSSLNYSHEFFARRMKIDRSLLRGISENIEGAAILVAIITVGHLAEMVVVAVGVETETQLAFLQEQNCDEVQGFLFCQPLPSPAMSEYLRNYQKPDQLSAS